MKLNLSIFAIAAGATAFGLGANPALADESRTCFNAVQGKVAYNQKGQRQWWDSNVNRLCKNAIDHRRVIACFQDEIARHDDWERGILACSGAGAEGGLSLVKAGAKPKRKKTKSKPKREFLQNLICSTKTVSVSDSFEANFVGKSEALRKVLVPGAVFHMYDLLDGSFAALGNNSRLPYPIYISFNDRTSELTGSEDMIEAAFDDDTSVSRTVDGTLEGAQQALLSLVRSRPNNANFASSFEVHEFASDTQLNIAMSGGASYNGFSMSSTFDFDENSEHHKIVGQFMQRYYGATVDFTQLEYGPSGWFTDDVIEDLRAAEAERGPLVFVDSVVYGRASYFFTETTKSDLAVKASLETAYEGEVAEGNFSGSADFKSSFSSNSLKVISIGGGNEDGQIVSSIEDFQEIVSRKPSATGLGDAIAYTIRFVDDHSVAMTNVATEFPERTCTPLNNKVSFGIDKIKVNIADDEGTSNGIEVKGSVGVRVEYDAFEDGKWVEKSLPEGDFLFKFIEIFEDLGEEDKNNIDKFAVFEIPDDPESEDVNEVKTARFIVSLGTFYEDDDSSSSDDELFPRNRSLDAGRTFTINDTEKAGGLSRPYFRLRGEDLEEPDADIELHFKVKSLN